MTCGSTRGASVRVLVWESDCSRQRGRARTAVRPGPPCEGIAVSAKHQREDSPTEVLALVARVAGRFGVELGPHFSREIVIGVLIEPAAEVEPLRRLVTVPAVLIGQHHLHDVAAEFTELLDQLG